MATHPHAVAACRRAALAAGFALAVCATACAPGQLSFLGFGGVKTTRAPACQVIRVSASTPTAPAATADKRYQVVRRADGRFALYACPPGVSVDVGVSGRVRRAAAAGAALVNLFRRKPRVTVNTPTVPTGTGATVGTTGTTVGTTGTTSGTTGTTSGTTGTTGGTTTRVGVTTGTTGGTTGTTGGTTTRVGVTTGTTGGTPPRVGTSGTTVGTSATGTGTTGSTTGPRVGVTLPRVEPGSLPRPPGAGEVPPGSGTMGGGTDVTPTPVAVTPRPVPRGPRLGVDSARLGRLSWASHQRRGLHLTTDTHEHRLATSSAGTHRLATASASERHRLGANDHRPRLAVVWDQKAGGTGAFGAGWRAPRRRLGVSWHQPTLAWSAHRPKSTWLTWRAAPAPRAVARLDEEAPPSLGGANLPEPRARASSLPGVDLKVKTIVRVPRPVAIVRRPRPPSITVKLRPVVRIRKPVAIVTEPRPRLADPPRPPELPVVRIRTPPPRVRVVVRRRPRPKPRPSHRLGVAHAPIRGRVVLKTAGGRMFATYLAPRVWATYAAGDLMARLAKEAADRAARRRQRWGRFTSGLLGAAARTTGAAAARVKAKVNVPTARVKVNVRGTAGATVGARTNAGTGVVLPLCATLRARSPGVTVQVGVNCLPLCADLRLRTPAVVIRAGINCHRGPVARPRPTTTTP